MELAAKPQLLLFLDEPTSGLDSQTAWSICSLLRKLADNGQAILCTIHQPSAILFQSFDRILLLAAGGKTIYFGDIGPRSSTITNYFQSKTGVGCPPEANPAEWILEQIGAAPGHHSLYDWSQLWTDSNERRQLRLQLDDMKETLSKKPVQLDVQQTTFATSFWCQTYWVTRRCFEQYWRTPTYLYSKCALCILPVSISLASSANHAAKNIPSASPCSLDFHSLKPKTASKVSRTKCLASSCSSPSLGTLRNRLCRNSSRNVHSSKRERDNQNRIRGNRSWLQTLSSRYPEML